MRGILADINIQGQVQILFLILSSEVWHDIWARLNLSLFTLRDLGLAANTSDTVVWQVCQDRGLLLLTGNRNQDGPDSLEATIRAWNTPDSLPVFTIADTKRVLRSRKYAGRVVESLLDYLIDIDNYRGSGRLYLP